MFLFIQCQTFSAKSPDSVVIMDSQMDIFIQFGLNMACRKYKYMETVGIEYWFMWAVCFVFNCA